jgi:hypothetical protein
MENTQLKIAALCLAALASAGCAGSSMVEANYGNAVRGNKAAQLHDPAAAANPPADAPETTDGMRLEGVMKTHRETVGSAESVSKPIVINVGG